MRALQRALLLALLAIPGAGCAPATDTASPAGQAMARTEALFRGAVVHGDTAFLLTQGAYLRGVSLRLQPMPLYMNNRYISPFSVEYTLWALRHERLPELTFTLPVPGAGNYDGSRVRRPADARQVLDGAATQARTVIEIMDAAVRCRGESPAAMVGPPDYHYVSTHQVLALWLAAEKDCFDTAEIEASISLYAGRVRDEFVQDLPLRDLTDLQIERAAVLCLLGHCEQVPDRFLQRLLREQGENGMWNLQADPLVVNGMLPPEHATALAYYVLARAARPLEAR